MSDSEQKLFAPPKHTIFSPRLIILIGIFLLVAAGALLFLQSSPPPVSDTPPVASEDSVAGVEYPDEFGVQTDAAEAFDFGAIRFIGIAEDADIPTSYLYEINLDTEVDVETGVPSIVRQLYPFPAYGYVRNNTFGIEYALAHADPENASTEFSLLTIESEDLLVDTEIQPRHLSRDLVFSGENSYFAYAFHSDGMTGLEELSQWSIGVYDFTNMEIVTTITAADRPQWLTDSHLIYLKQDGIYIHNVRQDNAPVRIFDLYQDLHSTDNIAIVPGTGQIILTLPTISTISLLELSVEGEANSLVVTEASRVVNPGTRYHSPIVKADASYYGVMATDQNNDTYFEVRGFGFREPTMRMPSAWFVPSTINVLYWQ